MKKNLDNALRNAISNVECETGPTPDWAIEEMKVLFREKNEKSILHHLYELAVEEIQNEKKVVEGHGRKK